MQSLKIECCVIRRIVSRAMLLLAFACASMAQADSNDKAVDDLVRQAAQAQMKGRPEDAVSLLRKALDLAPQREELYLLRSRARDSAGKFDGALEDANKYIELEPNDPYGYLNRARVYLSMEKKQAALDDANKAIQIAPNEPDAYYRRSDIYYDLDMEKEAKADEKKAEELDRKSR